MRSLDTQHTCPHIEAGEGRALQRVTPWLAADARVYSLFLLKLLDFIQRRAEGAAGGWFAGSGEQRVTLREERERESVEAMRQKAGSGPGLVTTYGSLYWYCLASRMTARHYLRPLPDLGYDRCCRSQWRGLNSLNQTNKPIRNRHRNCPPTSHLFNQSGFKSIFVIINIDFFCFFLQVMQATHVPFYHLRRHPLRGVRPRQDVMQRNKLSN